MEKSSKELPGNQRLVTQSTPHGQLFWPKEAPAATKNFKIAWEQFQNCWTDLKDKLSQEAFYDIPPKKIWSVKTNEKSLKN